MATKKQSSAPKEDMTLGDHLHELRRRLFRGVVAVVLCTIVAWCFKEPVYVGFMQPFERAVGMLRVDWVAEIEAKLVADPELKRTEFYITDDPEDGRLLARYEVEDRPLITEPGEGFMTKLKICLYVGMFAGGPVLLWQLWGFIASGLYKKERWMVMSMFPPSLVLFFSGVAFGFFVLVPYGMYYLGKEVSPDEGMIGYKLSTYFTFMSSLSLALGVVFQLPLLMIAMARTGLVAPSTFASYRGHFVLASFVIAAVLTPPDPFTQTMMAGPMVLLYELGLLSSRVAVRRAEAREA